MIILLLNGPQIVMYYLYAYDTVESGIKQLHLIERRPLLFYYFPIIVMLRNGISRTCRDENISLTMNMHFCLIPGLISLKLI